ncbi:N-glycosyltransferase [Sphingobacterium multivorum]|uniref:N-glycosyltransferase n=1 Tax=Sphingobacterium multivorum TaxID=28454 RepID=A0A2X2J2M9_SPHMU|nr:glycosyltransferase [Sphingobacterium multivorum]SPZ85966.1 N-glycosyltransferase [Sphingobacterium multivorum]
MITFTGLKYKKVTDSLVIIPTYNEKENIEKIIRKVFSLSHAFDILIVDDGSPDGTATIIKNLQVNEFSGRLFIEERIGKLGLGTAYIHGFKWALSANITAIFRNGCRFQPQSRGFTSFTAGLCGWCRHEHRFALYQGRECCQLADEPCVDVLFCFSICSFITGINIQDATAGFVCFTREVLRTIPLEKIKFVGYAFQIEMKFTAIKYGFDVVEVPIIFTDRTEGTSKMSTSIFKEAFFGVIQLKLGSIGKRYKRN